jgi:hypothetical protein
MMKVKDYLLLSLLLSSLCTCIHGLSIQSGPESGGRSVAGGIILDPILNVLYVTGATDGSFFGPTIDESSTNCFLATVNFQQEGWAAMTQLGNTDVAESCNALLRLGDSLYLAGAALEGGMLSELRARGSLKATVYGMILDVTTNSGEFVLQGGNLQHEYHVQYPIAMDQDSKYLYVASIISEDVTENKFYEPFTPQEYGYGSAFSVKVQRFQVAPKSAGDASLQQTLVQLWQREIGTSSSVYAAGLLYMSTSSLILTGATKGWDSGLPDATPGDDYDGIITELNPSTGLLTSRSFRVESQPERDERIYGSCKPVGDENDFYVVGMTTGNLESTDARTDQTAQAFIMKVEVDPTRGYSVKWIRQVGAEGGTGSNNVEGIACAVTPDARNVYMVGRVHANAVMSNTDQKSAGGTDMFIMQLDAIEGSTNYIRQIGSAGDDYVTDVTCDKEGNAIPLLTTLGSMYRDNDESKEQDIVVMSVSRADGTFDLPIGMTDSGSGSGVTPTEPVVNPPPPVAQPTGGTPPAPTPAATSPPVVDESSNDGSSTQVGTATSNGGGGDDKKGAKIAIAVIVLSVVALAGFLVYRRASNGKDLYYSDEDHVVEYLKGFDDVEVDLKHSATGGWHGTYLNPRYQSSDNYSYNSETTDTSIRFDGNSSYVRDSLFMDDYDAPSLSGVQDDGEMSDEREGLTRQRSNYDGLLDAYNTTWDELSPHVMPTASRPSPKRDLSNKKHVLETIDFMKDDDAWGKEII